MGFRVVEFKVRKLQKRKNWELSILNCCWKNIWQYFFSPFENVYIFQSRHWLDFVNEKIIIILKKCYLICFTAILFLLMLLDVSWWKKSPVHCWHSEIDKVRKYLNINIAMQFLNKKVFNQFLGCGVGDVLKFLNDINVPYLGF